MKAKHIRLLRAVYYVSQLQLATAVGVPQSRISRAESQFTDLSPDEIKRVQRFFKPYCRGGIEEIQITLKEAFQLVAGDPTHG